MGFGKVGSGTGRDMNHGSFYQNLETWTLVDPRSVCMSPSTINMIAVTATLLSRNTCPKTVLSLDHGCGAERQVCLTNNDQQRLGHATSAPVDLPGSGSAGFCHFERLTWI